MASELGFILRIDFRRFVLLLSKTRPVRILRAGASVPARLPGACGDVGVHTGSTVATTDVLPAGGRKPGGCEIEIVDVPTASGSNQVSW